MPNIPRVIQCMNTLMSTGLKNLRAFGYNNATFNNLCSDEVYRSMFYKMLKQTYEELPEVPLNVDNEQSIKNYRTAIHILQTKINKHGGNILD